MNTALASSARDALARDVLGLAAKRGYAVALIIGGGIDYDNDHTLILGEVIGGDESHWRAFVDCASMAQLAEAAHLLRSLGEAP